MLMTLLLAVIVAYVAVGLLFVACAVVMAGRTPDPLPVELHSTMRPRT